MIKKHKYKIVVSYDWIIMASQRQLQKAGIHCNDRDVIHYKINKEIIIKRLSTLVSHTNINFLEEVYTTRKGLNKISINKL